MKENFNAAMNTLQTAGDTAQGDKFGRKGGVKGGVSIVVGPGRFGGGGVTGCFVFSNKLFSSFNPLCGGP